MTYVYCLSAFYAIIFIFINYEKQLNPDKYELTNEQLNYIRGDVWNKYYESKNKKHINRIESINSLTGSVLEYIGELPLTSNDITGSRTISCKKMVNINRSIIKSGKIVSWVYYICGIYNIPPYSNITTYYDHFESQRNIIN